jgi:hypothetical protein
MLATSDGGLYRYERVNLRSYTILKAIQDCMNEMITTFGIYYHAKYKKSKVINRNP